VQTCEVCAVSKPCRISIKASLEPLPVPDEPGEIIRVRLLSVLDDKKEEHTAVLVAVDCLSK
jgi:hypothetical protein